VLHADVLVLEMLGFLLGLEQQAVDPLGDVYFPGFHPRSRNTRPALQFFLQGLGEAFHRDLELLQQPGNQSPFLLQQCGQEVLAVHLDVAHLEGRVLGGLKGLLGLDRHLVDVHEKSFSKKSALNDSNFFILTCTVEIAV
jgi:hypothetical protein